MQEWLIKEASKKYPKTKFMFCKSVEAFRKSLNLKYKSHIKFTIKIKKDNDNKSIIVFIESDQEIFGPQPYFCFKSKKNEYFHDNLVIIEPFKKWRYRFFEENVPPKKLDSIGIAANNYYGKTTIHLIKENFQKKIVKYLN